MSPFDNTGTTKFLKALFKATFQFLTLFFFAFIFYDVFQSLSSMLNILHHSVISYRSSFTYAQCIYGNKTPSYNLGQKIVGKFTNLSELCFSMEYFKHGVLRFFSTNVKICLLGGRLNTRHEIHFLIFPNFLRSYRLTLTYFAARSLTESASFFNHSFKIH